jgi:hypothetical protein
VEITDESQHENEEKKSLELGGDGQKREIEHCAGGEEGEGGGGWGTWRLAVVWCTLVSLPTKDSYYAMRATKAVSGGRIPRSTGRVVTRVTVWVRSKQTPAKSWNSSRP